jgi:molybdopterin molybdotransferase
VETEVAAGDTWQLELAPQTCVRIMTGAPVPTGADAVVRVEWTDSGTAKVAISQAVPPGSAIRLRGEEASQGDILLAAGTVLGAAQIGLLAAAGRGSVQARPCPG